MGGGDDIWVMGFEGFCDVSAPGSGDPIRTTRVPLDEILEIVQAIMHPPKMWLALVVCTFSLEPFLHTLQLDVTERRVKAESKFVSSLLAHEKNVTRKLAMCKP